MRLLYSLHRLHTTTLLLVLTLAVLPWHMGCGAPDDRPSTAVRDSAGILIVERDLPDRPLRLSAEPELTIGTVDGDPGEVLHRVRGAALLGSTLVIGDGGTNRLYYYTDGNLATTAGADGDGPGEFRRLGGLFAVGDDSLAAFDWRGRRLSYFDREGRLIGAGEFRTTDEGGVLEPIGPLGQGLLVQATPPAGTAGRTGLTRDSATYHRMPFEPDGRTGTALAAQPGDQRWVTSTGGATGWRPVLYGYTAHATSCGSGFFVSAGDRYEIRYHDADGELGRILRVDIPGRPVTDDLVSAAVAERVRDITDPAVREARERAWSETPHPEVLPAHGDIVASPECELWVQDFPAPGADVAWTVFTSDGEGRGRIHMPPGFTRLLAVERDRVVALFQDELGTEQVRIYGVQESE